MKACFRISVILHLFLHACRNETKRNKIYNIYLTVKRLLEGGELADLILKLAPYLTRNRNEAVEEPKTDETQNGEGENHGVFL